MTLNGCDAPLAYYFTIYIVFLEAAVYGKRERRQTHTISVKKEYLMSTGVPFSDVKNVHDFTEVMAWHNQHLKTLRLQKHLSLLPQRSRNISILIETRRYSLPAR